MTDERAEAAFRRAFKEVADAHRTRPDEPVRRPSRWLVPAAVAAAVAMVAVGSAVVWGGDGEPTAGPEAQSNVASSEGSPAEGWRQESIRDVVVQVPEEWGYGRAPRRDGCAGATVLSAPYVDVSSAYTGVLAIGCKDVQESIFGNLPRRLWSVHVTLEPAVNAVGTEAGVDGRETSGDWTRISRQVGSARITVWSDQEHLADAERIVESAEVVAQDHLGCPVVSPVPRKGFPSPEPGADITEIGAGLVESIAVCQYDRNVDEAMPSLVASRELTGKTAVDVIRAIQFAPVGGGPDQPQNCVDDIVGDTASVLLVHAGDETRELFVYSDWCFGNGIDDGVTKRALTTENCSPLYADRVRIDSASTPVYKVCGPGLRD